MDPARNALVHISKSETSSFWDVPVAVNDDLRLFQQQGCTILPGLSISPIVSPDGEVRGLVYAFMYYPPKDLEEHPYV